jgi:hypothetical protein
MNERAKRWPLEPSASLHPFPRVHGVTPAGMLHSEKGDRAPPGRADAAAISACGRSGL